MTSFKDSSNLVISGIVANRHFLFPAFLLKLDLNCLSRRGLLFAQVLEGANLILDCLLNDGANSFVQGEAEVCLHNLLCHDRLHHALRLEGRRADVGGQNLVLYIGKK